MIVAKRVNELEGGRKTQPQVRLAAEVAHDEYDDVSFWAVKSSGAL